jgi:hypothetical protein
MIKKGLITMIGFDILILAVAVSAAITLVGFAAKAYDIVRKDWSQSQLPAKQVHSMSR